MTTVSFPQRILDYEIRDQIGSGPNGVVYRAWDKDRQAFVALKVIPNALAFSEQFRNAIEPALLELQRQPHPNLCTILALEQTDLGFVIVEEYLEAVPLRDCLLENGQVVESRLFDVLIQSASALSKLHRNDFEHGNLHPRNFFYTTEGIVKLSDACFNAPLVTEPEFTPIFESGLLIDYSTDLRALGKILYWHITGREWHGADSPEPHDLQKYGLHNDTALIICHLLAKDAKENFATASDLSVSVKAVAEFRENHIEPVKDRKREASPRQYLMMSLLVVLLIVFWYVISSHT